MSNYAKVGPKPVPEPLLKNCCFLLVIFGQINEKVSAFIGKAVIKEKTVESQQFQIKWQFTDPLNTRKPLENWRGPEW